MENEAPDQSLSASTNGERHIRRRPRPVISCLPCRERKSKCDRLLPCGQCTKGGRAAGCKYSEEHGTSRPRPRPVEDRFHLEGNAVENLDVLSAGGFTGSMTGVTQPAVIQDLLERIRRLERGPESSIHETAGSPLRHETKLAINSQSIETEESPLSPYIGATHRDTLLKQVSAYKRCLANEQVWRCTVVYPTKLRGSSFTA
jgi:hypothetical protein